MHDKNLHTGQRLNSNFPIPEVPADDAWNSMKMLLDGATPPTSVPPKAGLSKGIWRMLGFGMVFIIGLASWWYLSKKQHSGTIATNSTSQHSRGLPVIKSVANNQKVMVPIAGADTTVLLNNNSHPATADKSRQPITATSILSNNSTPDSLDNKKAGSATTISIPKNGAGKPSVLHAATIINIASSNKNKKSTGTPNDMATATNNLSSNSTANILDNKKVKPSTKKTDTKSKAENQSSLLAGATANSTIANKNKNDIGKPNNSVVTGNVNTMHQQNSINSHDAGTSFLINKATKSRLKKDRAGASKKYSAGNNGSKFTDSGKVVLSDKPVVVNKIASKKHRLNNTAGASLKKRPSINQQPSISEVPADKIDNNNTNGLAARNSVKNTAAQKIKVTIHPSLPFNVADSIVLANATKNNVVLNDAKERPAATKQKNKKSATKKPTKNSKDNPLKTIAAGLQWNLNAPLKSSNYFTGTSGKGQPWRLLLPTIWASKKVNKGMLMLSFNLLQQNFIGSKVVSSSMDTVLNYNATTTSAVKTFGLSAGLQYNFAVTPAFSIGAGFNYTRQQKALLTTEVVSLIPGVATTRSTYVTNKPSMAPAYLKPSFITGKIEFACTRAKFDAGISLQVPITNLASAPGVNIKPAAAQVFFRWKIIRD